MLLGLLAVAALRRPRQQGEAAAEQSLLYSHIPGTPSTGAAAEAAAAAKATPWSGGGAGASVNIKASSVAAAESEPVTKKFSNLGV